MSLGSVPMSLSCPRRFGATLGGVPVLAAVAWPWPWLPVLGAGLSAGGAGLQALLGGSRLLRALARTRALPLPRALSRGRLWPLLVTLLTAALGVLLGSLDLLAPVLSVLCLTSHLGLNLACALQGLLPTAGWSPRCPLYHWSVSLAGALLCLSLMFVTCWHCALLALGIGATAYKYLEFRRPQLLVLSKPGDPGPPPRPELVALAAQLQGGGRGLTVLGAVLGGALHERGPWGSKVMGAHRVMGGYGGSWGRGVAVLGAVLGGALVFLALRVALARAGARGFVQVLVTPEPGAGLAALVQGVGLGALRPNTVLLGWPRRWRQQPDPARAARDFVELLRVAGAAGRALLVSKGGAEPGPAPGVSPLPGVSPGASPAPGVSPGGSLDVWWVVGTGRLLTLLPLLLRQHPVGGATGRGFKRGRGLSVAGNTPPPYSRGTLEGRKIRLGAPKYPNPGRAAAPGLPAQVHVVELHDGAVSDYTYERTLMMEQRSQMLRQLRGAQGGPAPSHPPSAAEEEEGGGGEPRRGPSPGNVRRMHAAERLNAAILAHSGGAGLVLLDLPPLPPPRPHRPRENYLEFLEVLTEGLGPVLLVRDGDGDGDQCSQYGTGNGDGEP
ncbi:solute carrier family 12 member 4-like [Camarhynchus parvulus]|uniref:solute carrier family 12 member 4-like n=1 Tax=Geospiza parvula TaxID=87175 RepID=UPI0012380F5A|nr:solute carrier family 12 member 4-like [Camarhynchus parvulus]